MGKTNTSFKKGERRVLRPKGLKETSTLVKESLGLTGWERMCQYIKNEGADKYIETLHELSGKEFVIAYNAMTEFVKPKLARTEIAGDKENPIEVSVVKGLTFEELYQLKYGKLP
jgi:hypothetical protein